MVVLIRPGYDDWFGYRSSGSTNGRRDNYTSHNIAAVASALATLKSFHGPRRLIVAGHSGGAAITAVIIGKYERVAQFVRLFCQFAAQ